MHESHQVQHVITHAQEMCAARKIAAPKKITILVGELLGFDEMSVRLHWEEFAEGTILEKAELVLQFVPAKLICPKCSAPFPKRGSDLSCPLCRVLGTPTASGKEFQIADITG
ncbi:MAG: hydrogenase maturation nickel metallochaperone HypA [Candidatus Omnitrophica bacterium]|nr:hydrogenase maturation nickel metallochaperone HypA [Candidatus Omnitrophota bacterium]